MARRYRKIDTRIWNDEKVRSLSDGGKLAFLFLLTHPHMTSLGAMRATVGGLAEELGWSPEVFRDALLEVLSKGMAEHDSEARMIALPNFIRYNPPESPNVIKAWVGSLDLLPECRLKTLVLARAKGFAEDLGEAFAKALPEAFAKGMPYQEQEQELEKEQEQEQAGSPPPASQASAPKKSRAPAKKAGTDPETETALQAACRETWKAYGLAFWDRYSTEPVRNQTVNAQVRQFVKRLGYEEAPAVAAFYVSHPQAFYVKGKHQFGLALRDAEGLRTEWATNRVVTDKQARQSDNTASNLSAADEAMRILKGKGYE